MEDGGINDGRGQRLLTDGSERDWPILEIERLRFTAAKATPMATAQTSVIDDLLSPIPGDSTAGIDLHSDPLWMEIKEASKSDDGQRMGGKTEAKEANWVLVRDLTRNAIATRSKDLYLAILLTEANVRLSGFSGLAESLELVSGLLNRFWDNLHPLPFEGDIENALRF